MGSTFKEKDTKITAKFEIDTHVQQDKECLQAEKVNKAVYLYMLYTRNYDN